MLSGVLAIKWRPNSFTGLVGQEHITKTLTNALSSQRLHHAYLFCGTRGIGKTTVARILAKSLSCEKGIAADACNECSACKSIDAGNYADLVEVDAASRTKVESTRELLDDMQFAPTKGRYKIYLIDEVHMLSNHSFNALLKSLEEPPPHIIFIFATTEPQKLPVTVLSRCLKFNLKAIDQETIASKLREILPEENVKFDEESLKLISHYASGSMRDALSLTDQAIAYCDSNLQGNLVAEMLGVTGIAAATEILEYVAAGDLNKITSIMNDMEKAGANFTELWDRMMLSIHEVTLASLKLAEGKELTDLAAKFSREELQLFYQISLNTKRELPWAPSMRSASEMAFIKMLSMQPLASSLANHKRGISIPSRIAAPTATEVPAEEKAEETAEPAAEEKAEEVAEAQAPVAEEKLEEPAEPAEENKEEPVAEEATEIKEDVAESETPSEPNDEENKTEDKEEPVEAEAPATEEKVEEVVEAPTTEEAATDQVADPLAATDAETSEEELAETPLDYASTIKQEAVAPATPEPEQAEVASETPPATPETEQAEVASETPPATPEPEQAEPASETPPAPATPEPASEPTPEPASAPAPEPTTDYTQPEGWAALVDDLQLTGITDSIIRDTRLAEVHGGVWILHCMANVKNMFTDEMIAAVESSIFDKINQSIQVQIEVGPVDATPAMLVNVRRKEMVEKIKQEPAVNNVINKLGGEIVEDSVRPIQDNKT